MYSGQCSIKHPEPSSSYYNIRTPVYSEQFADTWPCGDSVCVNTGHFSNELDELDIEFELTLDI